jgi:hypothetical protein
MKKIEKTAWLSQVLTMTRRNIALILELSVLALVGISFALPYLNMNANFTLPGVEFQTHVSPIKFFSDWLDGKADFPLWNPATGLGRSWIADPFVFAFNPFASIPMWFWGANNGSKIAVAIHFVIAGLGMWVVAKLMGFQWPTRLWASMLYMLSGGLVSHLQAGQLQLVFALAWLPWSLAGLLWVWQRKSYSSAAVASLAQAVFYFSGNLYYQIYAAFCYLIILIVLAVEWRSLKVNTSGLWKVAVMGVLSIGLISIQFLPLIAARNDITNLGGYEQNERDFEGSQKPVYALLNYIVADRDFIESPTLEKIPYLQESYRYIGISPFLFLILIVPAFKRSNRKREIVAVALCFLFMLCWAGVKYTFVQELYHNLPFIHQFRFPGRALSVGALFVILLGGFGLEELLAWINAMHMGFFVKNDGGESAMPLSVRMLLFAVALIGLAGAVRDVYASNSRVVGLEMALMPTVDEGYRWLRTQEKDAYTFGVFATDSINVRRGMAAYDQQFRMMSLVDGWIPVGTDMRFGRMEAITIEPRYWLFWEVESLDKPGAKVINKIGTLQIWQTPTFPFAFTVPLGRLDMEPFAITPPEVQPVVSYARDIPNRILVETNTSEAAMLVVSEAWFSGWTVKIDGKRTIVGSVSNLLAVPLPAGKHTVVFAYAPSSFTLGAVLSLIALTAILAIIIGEAVQNKRRSGKANHPKDSGDLPQ